MGFKKPYLILVILGCFLMAGCQNGAGEGDAVSGSGLNTEGLITFYELPAQLQHEADNLIVSMSPDKKTAYIMKPSIVKAKLKAVDEIIKGYNPVAMSLIREELATGQQEIIVADMPVATSAKWDSTGQVLAMVGGDHLTIYDASQGKVLMENILANEQITDFGWSPDGKKIYTSHPNLPNGSIIDLENQTISHKYENDVKLYYKGQLDSTHYYATYIAEQTEEELKKAGWVSVPKSVIADSSGNIVKIVAEGRFKDSYQRALLQVGENRFGLDYIPDINVPDKVINLTEEFVYDAKFVAGGKLAYIIKDADPEKNLFALNLVDTDGKLIQSYTVTGATMCLSPDGKNIAVKGNGDMFIDVTKPSPPIKPVINENYVEEIYATIRGAVDLYAALMCSQLEDKTALNEYFTDTHAPEQWALQDMSLFFEETKPALGVSNYATEIVANIGRIDEDKATMLIGFSVVNSWGSGAGEGWALELIKEEQGWLITGISTFPDSKESAEVYKVAADLVKKVQEGSVFEGQLKDKAVTIGQIQFWSLSSPHKAANIDYANYCKVYLTTYDNGQKKIYKLILEREGQNNNWKFDSFSDKNLSSLF